MVAPHPTKPSTVVAPHRAATSTVVATNPATTFNGGSPLPSSNNKRWQQQVRRWRRANGVDGALSCTEKIVKRKVKLFF